MVEVGFTFFNVHGVTNYGDINLLGMMEIIFIIGNYFARKSLGKA